jgi:hypothetical protein
MKNKDFVPQEGKNEKIRGQTLRIIFLATKKFPKAEF